MKHPIGFCVQPRAPEAASPTPAAQPEAAAVPSVVRVYFPERDRAYSYYNDRFDLHEGDVVYVSGKLAGLLGRVAAVDYNFRIRLADYERVIGAADRNRARHVLRVRLAHAHARSRRAAVCAGAQLVFPAGGGRGVCHRPRPRTDVHAGLSRSDAPAGRDRRQGTRLLCRGAGGLPVGRRHAGAHHRAGHGARTSSRSPTRAARSARSRAPVTRRDCASTVRRCCCSCARRSTSSARSTRRRLLRAIGSPP